MEISFKGKRILVTGASQAGLVSARGLIIVKKNGKSKLISSRHVVTTPNNTSLSHRSCSSDGGFYQMSENTMVAANKDVIQQGKRSTGIGRDLVKKLAACGAKVVAVARNRELLVSLQKEVPSIEIFSADLSDWKKAEEVLSQIGDIDLLVNNAGLGMLGPLAEVTEEDCDRVFAINVKSVINITKHVVKNLLARNVPGSIVNISSQASVAGLLHHTVYCASKGAVDAFTRAAALEFGPYGIRINTVNPTVIMTDMGKLGWSDPKVAGPMLEKIPLKRFGEVDEVVNAVIFLLSDMSSMTTGSSIYVDGGFLAV